MKSIRIVIYKYFFYIQVSLFSKLSDTTSTKLVGLMIQHKHTIHLRSRQPTC